MRTYIDARALGYRESMAENDAVVFNFYGPKGGTRSIEEISRKEAEILYRKLAVALGKED